MVAPTVAREPYARRRTARLCHANDTDVSGQNSTPSVAYRRCVSEEAQTEVEPQHVDRLLESSTMALYVSIILLGALVTVGKNHTNRELLGLIWGTTIGLTLAHFFAFRIASRLHRGFAAHRGDLMIAYSQVAGAAAVAALCSIPVLIFPESSHAEAVRFTLVLLLGVAGYMAG